MKRAKASIIILLMLACFTEVLGQAYDCPALVNTALQNVERICSDTGRNQVCYGNLALEATFQAGFQSATFREPGDQVDLDHLGTLRSTAADPNSQVWGVALMRVLANVPDTLPGQTVTMILFGGAQVENAVVDDPNAATSDIILQDDTVLLASPSADGQIVGVLLSGDSATVWGKSSDNLWLRIEMHDQDQRLGWIPVSEVDDPNNLPETPMQAFYLRPNFAGQSCVDAPDGMLVQTPGEGVKVNLTVNEVRIELGSTAFLSVDSTNELAINVLEGQGQVQAGGFSVDVPGGYRTEVTLDSEGTASSAPGQPEPYDAAALGSLPIVLLPEQVVPVESVWAIGQTLCVSNAGGAWMRGAPSSSNQDIVRVLAAGAAVSVSEAPRFDGAQSWWPVRTGNSTGWIEQSSLVACDQPVPPPCTPRTDWLFSYTVRARDTLSRIAQLVGITTNELITGNCLEEPYTLNVGTVLRIPRTPAAPTAIPTIPPPARTPDVVQGPGAAATEDPGPTDLYSSNWTIQFSRYDCSSSSSNETIFVYVTVGSNSNSITFTHNGLSRTLGRTVGGNDYSNWYGNFDDVSPQDPNLIVNRQYNLHITHFTGGIRAVGNVSEQCFNQSSSS
jgi:LysM repeat protein